MLIVSAVKVIAARVITAQGALLLSVVVGRHYGANDLGILMLTLSVIVGMSMISRFGTDQLIVKRGGIAFNGKSYRDYCELKKAVSLVVFCSCIFVLALGFVFSEKLSILIYEGSFQEKLVFITLISVPIYTVVYMQSAWLKAFGKPELSPLFETGAISAIIGLVVAICLYFKLVDSLTIEAIIMMLPIVAALIVVAGRIIIYKLSAANFGTRGVGKGLSCRPFDTNLMSELPDFFMISAAVYILGWAPIFLLGFLGTAEASGQYGVVHRVAFVLNFILAAFTSITAPKFAFYYKAGDMQKLNELLVRSCFFTLLLASPLAVLMLVFPVTILSLFGAEFTGLSTSLGILVLSQLVNLATGSTSFVLNMTGYQKYLKRATFQAALLLIFSSVILIPYYGVLGASTSVALASMYLNIRAVFLVNKYLSISLPHSLFEFLFKKHRNYRT